MNSPPAPEITLPDWEARIPPNEWEVYREVIRAAQAQGIPFAFGGAFATAVYTGELRNTKDFDFYILPRDRERMKQVVDRSGLTDHSGRLPYDPEWIYRASRGDVIVDTIWAMANQRAEVDEAWLTRGPEVSIRSETVRAIPIEELIWSKLYVLQRERCDWTDVFNLLDAQAEAIDWERLIGRMKDDAPLLAGAVAVFGWLAPDRAAALPALTRLGLRDRPPAGAPDLARARARLLDSRPWFTRHLR